MLTAFLALALATPIGGDACGGAVYWSSCHATTDGEKVDVTGESTQPSSSSSGDGLSPSPSASPKPDDIDCVTDLCRGGYAVESLPDVSASDLVSFVPQRPTTAGEPAGFGVRGMPTNVFAAASTHVLSGPLLGYDVRVRFTPVSYRFDYGDGTVRVSATGGSSWASLGLAQFSATPTTHAYTRAGTRHVSVSVVYDAHVDFGNGAWRPVSGTVTSAASSYDIRVVEVRTALVARTCDEAPRGPGC